MVLSNLQKYILRQVASASGKNVKRSIFDKFYDKQKKAPSKLARTKIITQSLERLIDRGLLVGSGKRTRYKWFITEVRLTPLGRKETQRLWGQQDELPFVKRYKKVKIKI
ncbi:MAG: hypothetical protein ACKKL5_02875 [Candidatus Komeilibacteria bacterium]